MKQGQVDALKCVVKTLGEIIEILSGPVASGGVDQRAIHFARKTLAAFNTPFNRYAFARYPYDKAFSRLETLAPGTKASPPDRARVLLTSDRRFKTLNLLREGLCRANVFRKTSI